MHRVLIALLAVTLLGGCSEPKMRLNAPPHGVPEVVTDMQGTFVYMTDNALLADMTVSDVHFVPHRAELNTLGEERVQRLAGLLENYGGAIRVSTNADEKLAAQRVASVSDLLRDLGLVVTTDTVALDLPGGAGQEASQAVLIKAGEGSYKPRGGAGRGAANNSTNSSGK